MVPAVIRWTRQDTGETFTKPLVFQDSPAVGDHLDIDSYVEIDGEPHVRARVFLVNSRRWQVRVKDDEEETTYLLLDCRLLSEITVDDHT